MNIVFTGGDLRVLLTGASRGIGRATALALAARGDQLVLCARSEGELAQVAREAGAKGVRAEAVPMDVTDEHSVRSAVSRALEGGPVDVLINNAGVFSQEPFLRQPEEQQRHEMEVNYFGTLRVTRAVLPSMIARRKGTIVNISSLLGAIPCPAVANYSATKAALNAWTHALRGEVEQHGVRTVVFMPSHTDTEQARTVTFEGVTVLPVEYTVSQLLYALDRAPRSFAASPVFRTFLRLAGLFPGWAEAQMAATTRHLLQGSAQAAH
jgi:short-subunit dehydrogenase